MARSSDDHSSVGPARPISLTIVSLSPNTLSGQEILAHLRPRQAESPTIDVDYSMHFSPEEQSIIKGLVGEKMAAQSLVISNKNFVDTMSGALHQSSRARMDGDRLFFRASEFPAVSQIIAQKEVDMLNALLDNGTPVFNAIHMKSYRVPPSDIEGFLADAVFHADQHAYNTCASYGSLEYTSGDRTRQVRPNETPQARNTRVLCGDHLDKLIAIVDRAVVKIKSVKECPGQSPIIDKLEVNTTSIPSTISIPRLMPAREYAIAQGYTDPPQPIALLPSPADRRGRESKPARKKHRRSPSRRASGGSNRESAVVPRSASHRPAWVCCTHGWRHPTMDMWYDTMLEYGCDVRSVQRLCALAQNSPEAHNLANQLFDKLIMWRRDGEQLKNPSAFIEKGVERARREMNPDGVVHSGKRKHEHR